MIGPYKDETVRVEVEVLEPEMYAVRGALESLREHGVKVKFF